MSIASEITRLTNAKTGIKTALEGKGVAVPTDAKIDTYGNLIEGIEVGVDTSDADATANDIIKDKTAYVNGQKVTGTLATAVNLRVKTANSTVRNSSIDQRVYFDNLPLGTQLVGDSTEIRVGANWDNLANNIGLAANRIKTGVTILGIEGTVQEGVTADKTIQAENAELETIQEITGNNDIGLSIISNPLTQSKLYEQGSIVEMHPTFTQLSDVLGLTANKLKSGVTICGVDGTYTSDADAVALDIEEGKTAYINGTKVIGTLPAVGSINFRGDNFYVTQMSDNKIKIKTNYSPTPADTEKFIINTTSNIYMEVPQEILANALGITADKIKSGVTICGVTGTYTGESTPTE